MKLIVHLLSADVRKFRLMIGLWIAISAVSTAIEGVRPLFASDVFSMNAIGVAGDLVWLAKLFFGFVLIPLVVHMHPLVGSDAFWLTRPIPPRTLMASKLALLAAAIVVVPVACELALMIAYKVPPQRMAAVAVQTILWQALYLTVVMALAALTRNLARFALLCGGVLLALAVMVMITTAIAIARMDDYAAVGMMAIQVGPPTPNLDDATSGMVFLLAVVASGLALLTVQYATRSTRRAAIVGVAGLVAAWALSSMWPWPVLQPRLMVPDWATHESSLRLTADPQSVEFAMEDPWITRKQTWRIGRAQIRLEGIEPGWLPTVRVTGAVLDLQPDVHLSSRGFGYAARVPIGTEDSPPLSGVVRAALGVNRLAVQDFLEPEGLVVVAIRDADFTRYAPGTGHYRGHAAVELTREEVVATLPLRAGATFQEDAYRVVLDEVRLASRNLSVRARISDARTVFDRRPTPRYAFYLRNPQRGEAVGSSLAPMQPNGLLTALLPGHGYSAEPGSGSSGFAMGGQFMRFPPGYPPTVKERLDIDEAWMAGAEIVIVRETTEGSVSRPLEIRDFPLRIKASQP